MTNEEKLIDDIKKAVSNYENKPNHNWPKFKVGSEVRVIVNNFITHGMVSAAFVVGRDTLYDIELYNTSDMELSNVGRVISGNKKVSRKEQEISY